LEGDADTLAAIAGGLAEARFEMPVDYAAEAWQRMSDEMHLWANAHVTFLFIGIN